MSTEYSPRWRRKRRRQLKAQEKRWEARSGPVTSYVDPSVVRRADQADGRDDRSVEATAK